MVPSPASIEEERFFSTAMFLLRRLPRDAANLLDVSFGYTQLPYRDGWNLLHRSGPGPSMSWIHLSSNGSRVIFEDPGVDPEDVQEIFVPFETLEGTSVWKWMTEVSSQHSDAEWAKNMLETITRLSRDFDDPPTKTQLQAALKLAAFEVLIETGAGEAEPEAIFDLLLRKYVALEAAGEPTSLILAICVGELAGRSSDPLQRILQIREQFVELIDRLIEDRRHQLPQTFGLMTHVASLYGFIAMKISMQLNAEFDLPNDIVTVLKKSDSYVDERLVSDIQTLTIEAASPRRHLLSSKDLEDADRRHAPVTDVFELLKGRYWPQL